MTRRPTEPPGVVGCEPKTTPRLMWAVGVARPKGYVPLLVCATRAEATAWSAGSLDVRPVLFCGRRYSSGDERW